MDLYKKIEEVRRQPEHIRLRWMYGSVAVVMALVILIWLLSIKVNFYRAPHTPEESSSVNELFDQSQQQPSIEQLLQEEI